MRRRYKNRTMQAMYDVMVRLFREHVVYKPGGGPANDGLWFLGTDGQEHERRGSATRNAFWNGYHGVVRPGGLRYDRRSPAHACYMAGRDCRRAEARRARDRRAS